MNSNTELKELLSLLKEIEKQTQNSNKALENYTKQWEKLKVSVNKHNSNSSSGSSSKSNAALSHIGNASMSVLSAYGGKAGGQMASLAGSVSGMSAAAGAAVGVVGAVALGLTAIAVEGKKAATVNQQVAKGLAQLGETQTKYTQDAIYASNSMNRLKNSWSNTVLSLQQTFTPFFSWLADSATSIMEVMGATSSINYSQATIARGSLATSARSQGFSTSSAQNLSNGIYNMALTLGERYGVDPNSIISDLAGSVFNGTNAAASYGLFSDDATLSGYMSSKGIDSINSTVSEATKSYQRFLLLQEQLNGSVGEESVNAFRKLGEEISSTKNALFSFDEVITLNGYSSEIPEVGEIPLNYTENTSEAIEGIKELTNNTSKLPFIVEQIKLMGEYAFELGKNLSTVGLPELATELNSWVSELLEYLNGLGLEIPVGLLVPEEEKEKLTGQVGTVNIPVTFEGLVSDFKSWLNNLANSLSLTIPVNFEGVLSDFESWLNKLSSYDLQGFTLPVGLALPESEKEKIKKQIETFKFSIPVTFEGFTQGFESILNNFASFFNNLMVPEPEPITNGESSSIAQELGQVLNNNNLVYSLDANSQNILTNLYRQASFLATKIEENTNALSTSSNNQKSLLEFYNSYISLLNSTSSMNEGQTFLSSLTGSTFSANQGTATTSNASTSSITEPTLGQKAQEALSSAGQAVLKFLNGSSTATDPLTGSGINSGLGLGITSTTLLPSALIMGIPLFADGGISTEFTLAGISEGGKKEAVIPLESESGITYLAQAMNKANTYNGGSTEQVFNITLPGNVFINNESQLNRLAEVIASKIAIQNSRRGNL